MVDGLIMMFAFWNIMCVTFLVIFRYVSSVIDGMTLLVIFCVAFLLIDSFIDNFIDCFVGGMAFGFMVVTMITEH